MLFLFITYQVTSKPITIDQCMSKNQYLFFSNSKRKCENSLKLLLVKIKLRSLVKKFPVTALSTFGQRLSQKRHDISNLY